MYARRLPCVPAPRMTTASRNSFEFAISSLLLLMCQKEQFLKYYLPGVIFGFHIYVMECYRIRCRIRDSPQSHVANVEFTWFCFLSIFNNY